MRQCESVWPEENRGKCFGTAALAGGGAEGRGSRRFSGAPYGFALPRGRARAEQTVSVGARGSTLVGARGVTPVVRGVTLVVRGSTLAGASADAWRCEGRGSLVPVRG